MNESKTSGNYADFIARKHKAHGHYGIDIVGDIHSSLFAWQAEVVRWALRKGRACLFEDTGLGKTRQQLVWASYIPGDVLILTPLSVAEQTRREAMKIGIEAAISRNGQKAGRITISNYEQLAKFDLSTFTGLVLDESSILKSQDGATRNYILDRAASIPYRLACTATPSPNDHMELGNQAEFVGASSRAEMLATYFCHDGGDTSQWRLKGHAKRDFWRWVATWAMMLRTPRDIGFECDGYDLPPLMIHEHMIETGIRSDGELFVVQAQGLLEQRQARKMTLADRVAEVARMVNESSEQWVVWCELNAEGDQLERMIDGAVQVAGATDDDDKTARLNGFSEGNHRVIVTKAKIAGFGMNWQNCHNMAFVGLSNSWEQFYQAVRRCYRFGQTLPVNVHLIVTDVERGVLENIKAKQASADIMAGEMVALMEDTMKSELGTTTRHVEPYVRDVVSADEWTMHRGDCVEIMTEMPDDSVGFAIYSPPFSSLYTYSASDRDMGNCKDDDEFFEHYTFMIKELYRVLEPGRNVSFHCMDLPSTIERDGFIGLRDFRGELIRAHQAVGFILHSQVTIWKDPVTAMQRTKALGLLHKQIRKDSAMSRQGIPDYLVTMRKPGKNLKPISHTSEEFPVEKWQNYASPVWMDINPFDTLQYTSARENEDERHICPLQLPVIKRAMELWTAPGDIVLSPYAGIGSEGFCAVEMERKFIGCELKKSYFEQACRNLRNAGKQLRMF